MNRSFPDNPNFEPCGSSVRTERTNTETSDDEDTIKFCRF